MNGKNKLKNRKLKALVDNLDELFKEDNDNTNVEKDSKKKTTKKTTSTKKSNKK